MINETRVWAVHENQQAEIRLYSEKTWPLHTGGGKPGQGYPLIMTMIPFASFDHNASGQYEQINDGKIASTAKVQSIPAVAGHLDSRLIVRKLTPLECERLMGWPDGWTEFGIDDDDQTVSLAATHRYRICGNGIVSNVTHWLGDRLNDIAGGVNSD